MTVKPTLMTPKARLSFTQQLFTPKAFNGGKAKYGCTLRFYADAQADPKFKAMQAAAAQAAKDKFGDKATTMRLKSPFLKGEDYPQYAGCEGALFIRVSTEFKPGFVDRSGQEVPFDEAEEKFYSGAYARATLNVFAYDSNGNRGVAFGLRNLQWLGDGDRLGGRVRATDEFEPVGEVDDPESFFAAN